MNLIHAVILGLIQGITEWLPISSSGHLVLAQNLLNITESVMFDIFLHLGSVLVILLVFYKDILNLIKGLISKEKAAIKTVTYLVIASIPIALVGYLLNAQIKQIFNNNLTVGISLLITALLLFLSKYPQKKDKHLTMKSSIAIGFAQALAILPGISRSGATISVALMSKVKREEAARFSFLLAIPAILGAAAVEMTSIDITINLLVAVLITIISGFFTLKLLLKIIKHQKFHYFGWYCLIVGIIVLFI